MYAATYSFSLAARCRLLGGLALAWLLGSAAFAAPFYSQFNNGLPSHYQVSNNCNGACAGGGVKDGTNAVDSNLSNYALVVLTLTNPSNSLKVDLNGTGKAGDRAGFLVARDNGLTNLSVASAAVITTYLGNTPQETRAVSLSLLNNNTLGDEKPVQLEFVAGKDFNKMQIEFSAVVSLGFRARVYYAYAVPTLVAPPVRGTLSTTGIFSDTGTSPGGTVCVNSAVTNGANAADADLTNYATFSNIAAVSCPPALKVKLADTAPSGFFAGFVIGSSGLLDAGVLPGLRVSTSLNGVPAESFTGAGVLELNVLPGGKARVSFPGTLAFNEVKIERVGAVTALDNLRLYYGFGLEPAAFEPSSRVLSDNPAAAGNFQVTSGGVACANCGITNPQNAADSNVSPSAPPAIISSGLSIASTLGLKVDLNGTGVAGSRAGMVIGAAGGLLDVAALSRITLTTYDAAGNVLESSSGAALLAVSLLPDGRQEIAFTTTRDFSSVQLSVAAGAALANDVAVHYAFSDNRPGGFPAIITPLPVTLVAFSGKWAGNAAELSWATASEEFSSHFVVERATDSSLAGAGAFRAVGRVEAAGHSQGEQHYQLHDREARALNGKVLYYRLRQVDIDGQESFSPVVTLSVRRGAAPQLQVFPNPAATATDITFAVSNFAETGGLIQIYAELGQLAAQVPLTGASARLPRPLAAGLYHVVLRDRQGQPLATQRLAVAGR